MNTSSSFKKNLTWWVRWFRRRRIWQTGVWIRFILYVWYWFGWCCMIWIILWIIWITEHHFCNKLYLAESCWFVGMMFVKLVGNELAWFESGLFKFLRRSFSTSKKFSRPAFWKFLSHPGFSLIAASCHNVALLLEKSDAPLNNNSRLPRLVTSEQLLPMVLGGFIPMP